MNDIKSILQLVFVVVCYLKHVRYIIKSNNKKVISLFIKLFNVRWSTFLAYLVNVNKFYV